MLGGRRTALKQAMLQVVTGQHLHSRPQEIGLQADVVSDKHLMQYGMENKHNFVLIKQIRQCTTFYQKYLILKEPAIRALEVAY